MVRNLKMCYLNYFHLKLKNEIIFIIIGNRFRNKNKCIKYIKVPILFFFLKIIYF